LNASVDRIERRSRHRSAFQVQGFWRNNKKLNNTLDADTAAAIQNGADVPFSAAIPMGLGTKPIQCSPTIQNRAGAFFRWKCPRCRPSLWCRSRLTREDAPDQAAPSTPCQRHDDIVHGQHS
jgi:hypothetical protein